MAAEQHGIFGRLAHWVMTHTKLAVGAILGLCVLSGLLAAQLTVNPNILDLLPAEAKTTQAIQKLNREEGGANVLSISFEGGEAEARQAILQKLGDQIRERDDIDYVLYDIEPSLKVRLGMLQLTLEELRDIRVRMASAIALGPALTNPFVASQVFALGPLTERLSAPNTQILQSNENVSTLIVRPKISPFDTAQNRPFMADIYALIDQGLEGQDAIQVGWVGGAYRHADEEVSVLFHDLSQTAILSFCFIVVLISIGFRELRSVFIIFVPLLIGSLWTWGFASLVVGSLNSFTSFFTAILLGLGVDFSIHLYSRYREERARVESGQEAVIRAWDQVGPPCFTAAVTSAAGFISLQFAGFVGFKQLGILLCGGVLLCLMAILITLPLLIQLRERQAKPVKVAEIPKTSDKIPEGYRFSNLGLAIALTLGAVALSTLDRVGFEYDMSNLRKLGLSYEELDEGQRAFAERSFAPVIASFPDAESLYAAHVALNSAAENSPIIRSGLSQFTVLPNNQAEKLAELEQIYALATHENAIYLPGMLKQNLQPLVDNPPKALSVADFPPGLQHILGASNGHHRLVIAPSGNMWDIRQNAELRDELERLLPNAELAGEYLAMASLFELIKDDGPKISIIALTLVFMVSLLDLRSIKRAISAVVILATGIAWAGAAMWMMDIKLSLLNFVGIPIMMGIGIDIIIHLLHRIDQEGPGRIGFALRTTGWAAVLSTLTTMFSFAALLIAENRGIHSLGQMIVAGLFLVGTAAFIAVPLGWISVWRRRGQA